MGLAWAANWYAVKAWASRSLRQARWHGRGPGESLFVSSWCWVLGDHLPSSIHLFGF